LFPIFYDERAVEELAGLDTSIRSRVIKSIGLKLATAPDRFGKPLRGSLKGDWSLRIGDYRVLYRIEKETVVISRIGHRREVYE
jgi:mRNA interferase RelE/StbE